MLFGLAPERRQLASPPRIKAAVEVDASVRRSVERLATLAAATILPMQSEAALSGPSGWIVNLLGFLEHVDTQPQKCCGVILPCNGHPADHHIVAPGGVLVFSNPWRSTRRSDAVKTSFKNLTRSAGLAGCCREAGHACKKD